MGTPSLLYHLMPPADFGKRLLCSFLRLALEQKDHLCPYNVRLLSLFFHFPKELVGLWFTEELQVSFLQAAVWSGHDTDQPIFYLTP